MPASEMREQNLDSPRSLTVALPLDQSDTVPLAAEPIRTALEAIGAKILFFPTLTIESLLDHSVLDQTLRSLNEPDESSPHALGEQDAQLPWLLLPTSPAVQIVVERLTQPDSAGALSLDRTIALGLAAQATLEQQIREHNLQENRQNRDSSTTWRAQSPAELAQRIPSGSRLLIPVAEHAHEPLLDELTRLGFHPIPIPAYSRFLAAGGDPVPTLLFQGGIDALIFPSPDHLNFFRRRLAREGGGLIMLDHVYVLCADEWTAQTARAFGLRVDAVIGALDAESITNAVMQLDSH
jgi:uroporphyrinogen-III synthase